MQAASGSTVVHAMQVRGRCLRGLMASVCQRRMLSARRSAPMTFRNVVHRR